MSPHSSTPAWKSPWTEEPGRLQGWTRLSDFTFTFHFHALEKEMETHSSVLAWRIPGMGEPGGLPSMGRTESDMTEVTQQQQQQQPHPRAAALGASGLALSSLSSPPWGKKALSSCCLCWSPMSLYPRQKEACFLSNTAASHTVLHQPRHPSSPSETQGFPDRMY